jgi:hypothetical protein
MALAMMAAMVKQARIHSSNLFHTRLAKLSRVGHPSFIPGSPTTTAYFPLLSLSLSLSLSPYVFHYVHLLRSSKESRAYNNVDLKRLLAQVKALFFPIAYTRKKSALTWRWAGPE